jgi:hypothetical protein
MGCRFGAFSGERAIRFAENADFDDGAMLVRIPVAKPVPILRDTRRGEGPRSRERRVGPFLTGGNRTGQQSPPLQIRVVQGCFRTGSSRSTGVKELTRNGDFAGLTKPRRNCAEPNPAGTKKGRSELARARVNKGRSRMSSQNQNPGQGQQNQNPGQKPGQQQGGGQKPGQQRQEPDRKGQKPGQQNPDQQGKGGR